MRVFALSALLAFGVIWSSTAQDKPKAETEGDLHRCFPKIMSRASHRAAPQVHFRKGERYKNIPIVAYQVLESGEVAHAFVKRSSGVADIDKYALYSVRELKFNERPGCLVVDSEAGITVDLR